MRASLTGTLEWLKSRSGETDPLRCLVRRRVVGFTVCPPSGKDKTQGELKAELDEVLEAGFPIALYQLPQITGNRMEPATVIGLAARHPNLLLFKDSSGEDAVAKHRPQPAGVFLVRGAEGDYARWLRLSGGVYDGLLLSSANCFPRELKRLIRDLERRRMGDAQKLSQRLTEAVTAVFEVVREGSVPGNAFAAANKAMDHFMAFGPHAVQIAPPMLHGGHTLPRSVLRQTADILRRHDLLPSKGYLD
jgi:dihydrodipicolinate synthase/N-acetylneuraminate lyase